MTHEFINLYYIRISPLFPRLKNLSLLLHDKKKKSHSLSPAILITLLWALPSCVTPFFRWQDEKGMQHLRCGQTTMQHRFTFYLNFLTFLAALHFYLLRMTLSVILLHQTADDRDMMIYVYYNSRARTVYHVFRYFSCHHVSWWSFFYQGDNTQCQYFHEGLCPPVSRSLYWIPCSPLEACIPLSSLQPKFSIFPFSISQVTASSLYPFW